jgi:hypothetical protein
VTTVHDTTAQTALKLRFVYGAAAATRSVTWTSTSDVIATVKFTVASHSECGIAVDHFGVAVEVACGFAVAATTVFPTTATIFTANCAVATAPADVEVQVASAAVDYSTCSALENENS